MKLRFCIAFFVLASMNLMAQEESRITSDQKKVIDFPKVELSIQEGLKCLDHTGKNSSSEQLINPLSENNSFAEISAELSQYDLNCICPITNYKVGYMLRKLMLNEALE